MTVSGCRCCAGRAGDDRCGVGQGLGFYAVEYPGYGLSASTPVSEEAIYSTAEAALHAREKTVPKQQIILMGQSLGSGVAVEMARRGHGTRLMLVAPTRRFPMWRRRPSPSCQPSCSCAIGSTAPRRRPL